MSKIFHKAQICSLLMLLLFFVITFMQSIYNYRYIPETNNISRVYSFAAVLYLQSVLHVLLFHTWNMFCTMYYISILWSMCAVPNMAAFCRFPGMLLSYCLNDFQLAPVARIMTGITFTFTFHMYWISIIRYLYIRIFSTSFLITFLSPEIATSINTHVPFPLSWIMMYVLLLWIVLSVCTHWFHKIVTSPSRLVSTYFGTFSYKCSLSNFTPFPCIC